MTADNSHQNPLGEEAADSGNTDVSTGTPDGIVPPVRQGAVPGFWETGFWVVIGLLAAIIAIWIGIAGFLGFLMYGIGGDSSKPSVNRDYAQSSVEEIEDLYHAISAQIDTHIQETYQRESLNIYGSSLPKESTSSCEGGRRVYYKVGFYEKIKVNQLNDLVEYVSTVVEPYGYQNRDVRSTTYDNYDIRLRNRNGDGSVHIKQGADQFYISFRTPCYAHAKEPTDN